jgi:apolipoprotein N-acyltransferase
MKRTFNHLIPFMLGLATVMAFAPWNWFVLALLAPAILEWRLQKGTIKQAVLQGFLYGLGFFSLGVSWVYFSIHDYSEAPIIVGIIITLGLILLMSAFYALLAYLYRRLFPQANTVTRLFCFPALWVLCDWLRAWFLSGFPWLFLGYSLLDTPLAGFGPIIGVYGLTYLCVFMGILLLRAAFGNKKQCIKNGVTLIVLLVLGFYLQLIQWTKPIGEEYRIALIQGNIDQDIKWEPAKFQDNFLTYLEMTQAAAQSDVIIWPEAALPVPLPYGQPYVQILQESILPSHTVVFGAITMNENEMFHNTVQVVGNGDGEYEKFHLVPFGEYVPFYKLLGKAMDLLHLPMSLTIPGPRIQAPLQVQDWQMGALICYEVVFPSLSLTRAQDSDILLTISNDTWFGRSLGPLQHFQMSRMRALETGRYLVRATNNGISGFIDPKGNVVARAEQYVSTTLISSAQGMRGKTPLMLITHYTILALNLLLIVAFCLKKRYKTTIRNELL